MGRAFMRTRPAAAIAAGFLPSFAYSDVHAGAARPCGIEEFFSEQLVLGEIVAQHLENRLHGHVSRKFDLGGTLLTQQAMESGELDVYPEYTGTALTAVLKQNR
jgi:glycine betaine/choline ABC-type transport system substrate-binding protein